MFNKPTINVQQSTKQDNNNNDGMRIELKEFSHTIFGIAQNVSIRGGMSFNSYQTNSNNNNSKTTRTGRKEEKLEKKIRTRDRSRQRHRRRGRHGYGNNRHSVKRSREHDRHFHDRRSGGHHNPFDELFERRQRRRRLQINHTPPPSDDNDDSNKNNDDEKNGAANSFVKKVSSIISIVDPQGDLHDGRETFVDDDNKDEILDDGLSSFVADNKREEILDGDGTGLTDTIEGLDVNVPPSNNGLDFSESSGGETKNQKKKKIENRQGDW